MRYMRVVSTLIFNAIRAYQIECILNREVNVMGVSCNLAPHFVEDIKGWLRENGWPDVFLCGDILGKNPEV